MDQGRPRAALGLVVPFVIWALGFVLLYGGHGLACAVGVRTGQYEDITRASLAVLLGVVLCAHIWIIGRSIRRLRQHRGGPYRFVVLVSVLLAVGAAGATLWTGLPVLALKICGLSPAHMSPGQF